MSQIVINIHQQLADRLFTDKIDGARQVAILSRQSMLILQKCGRRIAYAPIYLTSGEGCAMSVRGSGNRIVVEIDPPGTTIPGRGVIRDSSQDAEQSRIAEARRLKKNRH